MDAADCFVRLIEEELASFFDGQVVNLIELWIEEINYAFDIVVHSRGFVGLAWNFNFIPSSLSFIDYRQPVNRWRIDPLDHSTRPLDFHRLQHGGVTQANGDGQF